MVIAQPGKVSIKEQGKPDSKQGEGDARGRLVDDDRYEREGRQEKQKAAK